MKIKTIKMTLAIHLGNEGCKQTRVAPYVRVRNGKKELVKGYLRRTRNLDK